MKATLLLYLALLQTGEFDSILRDGLVALQRSDLSVAAERLTRATQLKPDSGIAWAALAQAHLKLQKTANADKAAHEAERVGGDQPVVIRALTIYWSGRGEAEPLIRLLRKTAFTAPVQEQPVFDLVQLLLSRERFDEAAQASETGLKSLPDSAQLQLALGVARYAQRRFSEAIASFLKTIELQPEVEQPYVFLGKILDHAGDRLPEIDTRVSAFLKTHPDHPVANLVYAKTLLRRAEPNLDLVEQHLKRSLANGQSSWEAHFELGVLLARKRQYEPAAAELAGAIKLAPSEPAPHYHLARVYDRLGKPAEAAAERTIHETLTKATVKKP